MPVFKHYISILLLIATITGCASLPEEMKHPIEPSPSQRLTSLTQLTASYEPNEPKDATSAVLIQNTGWDALSQRLALIESAEQSIDIQYYIWNSDSSGSYLASRLLAAANRGVQVRVMLDDINLNERESLLAALDLHPKIEIRIFNPIPSRHGFIKWVNVLSDFSRLNRRMHNKSFTVDGTLAIVGGRNIGDEYFDLSDEINFRDRDVLVMGSVVSDIQTSFTQYWSSRWSYPVNLLTENVSPDISILENLEAPIYQHYPPLPAGNKQANTFLKALLPEMTWVKARFISDQAVPDDASNTDVPKATAKLLTKLAQQSTDEMVIESAYLIFDDRQLNSLNSLASKGVKITALTNSMASNDLVTNHSGYAGRRKDMLKEGIQLFELKPDSNLCEDSTKNAKKCAPTAPYGLHAKSVVFDENIAVIGSFNFNLRSTYLNTESLLIIENQSVATQLKHEIKQAMSEENSWRLDLTDGKVHWYSGEQNWDKEPETDLTERITSRLLQLLPIEKYL